MKSSSAKEPAGIVSSNGVPLLSGSMAVEAGGMWWGDWDKIGIGDWGGDRWRVKVRIGLPALVNVESIADSIRRTVVTLPLELARRGLSDRLLPIAEESLRLQYAQFGLR